MLKQFDFSLRLQYPKAMALQTTAHFEDCMHPQFLKPQKSLVPEQISFDDWAVGWSLDRKRSGLPENERRPRCQHKDKGGFELIFQLQVALWRSNDRFGGNLK